MSTGEQGIPFFFNPGYGNTLLSDAWGKSHEPLFDILRDNGFSPITCVEQDWKDSDFADWKGVFYSMLEAGGVVDEPGTPYVIGGHSIGGLLAISLAADLDRLSIAPQGIMIASGSPYFEGMADQFRWHAYNYSDTDYEQMAGFQREAYAEECMPACVSSLIQWYVGEQEMNALQGVPHHIRGVMSTVATYEGRDPDEVLTRFEVLPVPKAGHDVLAPAYLDMIAQNIGRLAANKPREPIDLYLGNDDRIPLTIYEL
jgi:hypothetical protein